MDQYDPVDTPGENRLNLPVDECKFPLATVIKVPNILLLRETHGAFVPKTVLRMGFVEASQ